MKLSPYLARRHRAIGIIAAANAPLHTHTLGHPANHNYMKCDNCGTWRKVLQVLQSVDGVITRAECPEGCGHPSTAPSHLDPKKPSDTPTPESP